MLRQTFEHMETDEQIRIQMQTEYIASEMAKDSIEGIVHRMTQKRFNECMKIADEVSRKWL